MRGGHTKQKAAAKKVENASSNDGPSSTTRRSKAIRAGKEEAESKETPKTVDPPVEQGRRRRASSRSTSSDNKGDKEKGPPKTRSSDSNSQRQATKRTSSTPRKSESKTVDQKESDKHLETPSKRKTARRDQGTNADRSVTSKARTPLSDRYNDKRGVRATSGRPPHNASANTKDKLASKEAKPSAASNAVKQKDDETSDLKRIDSKEETVRSDSETESERELSGEFVYVDTDESEVKFNVKEAQKVDECKSEVVEKEAETQNIGTGKHEDTCVNVDADKTVEIEPVKEDETVHDTLTVSNSADGDECTADDTLSREVNEDGVDSADHESKAELVVGDNDEKVEASRSDDELVNTDATPHESEISSLALHHDNLTEHIPSETGEGTRSENLIESDKIGVDHGKTANEDTQLTDRDDVKDLSKGENEEASESTKDQIITDDQLDDCDSSVHGEHLNSQATVAEGDDQTADKDESAYWLGEHALSIDTQCENEAETNSRSLQNIEADADNCSTTSTNNDSHISPGSQQGRSKHRGAIRPGMDFTQGSRLEACDFLGKWYPAKVIDVDWKEHEVLIHFERWSSRFDEWVSMDSPRLRAITRTSARKEFRQKLQEVFKIGETVLARWVDGKMYPAKVAAFNPNGSFQVVFHDDGIQKTVKYTNITKLKEDQVLPLNQATAPLLPEKKKSGEAAPSRSSSREKKPSKRTLSPDDSLSPSARSPCKIPKKAERVPDVHDQKQKRIVKNEKRPSASGVAVRRKKLLVGGIFQAKRPDAESPKRALASRAQSVGNKRPAKRLKTDVDVESHVQETEEKTNAVESGENTVKIIMDGVPEEEMGDDGQLKIKKMMGGHAPKEFIIEEDHNHFKCPIDDCGKGFRKETLLASHMKHYHKADNKAYSRRRNESEGSRGESMTIKTNPPVDVSKEGTLVTEKPEVEKRTARSKPHESEKKIEAVSEQSTDITVDAKEKEVKKIRAKPEPLLIKPREPGKKGVLGSRQKHDEAKQPGSQRRRTPSDTNKGGKRKMEPKAKAGPSHSLKEEEKDSAKTRSLGVKDKVKRRKVAGGALKSVEKPDLTEDESSFKVMFLDDESAKDTSLSELASPRGHDSTAAPTQNVRKPGKKRKPTLAASQPKEEPSSFVGDYGALKSPTELAEFPPYEDDDDGGREEVVNCICRIREEDGLMMQCENCMAWQHGACFNIEEEEKVPNKYICFACQSPQGQRESYRYWYDQDWWKSGEMACFNFLSKDHHSQQLSGSMYKTHSLASSVYSVNNMLRSLRVKLEVAKNTDHPDLQLWTRPWTDGNQSGSLPTVVLPLGTYNNPKQKGELSYCDHSYSAPNRALSHSKQGVASSDLLSTVTEEGLLSTLPAQSDSLTGSEESLPAGRDLLLQAENGPVSQKEYSSATNNESEVASQAVNHQGELTQQSVDANGDLLEVISESHIESSAEIAAQTSVDTLAENSMPNRNDAEAKSGSFHQEMCKSDEPQVKEENAPPLVLPSDIISTADIKSEEIELKAEDEQVTTTNTAGKLSQADSKPLSVTSPVKIEPPTTAIHSSIIQHGEESIDHISCQMNLLDHIEQMQEELDRRLEEISQHVESLEMEYDIPAAASHRETLADLPSTKRLVRLMQFNLSKVQRMAALQ